MIKKKPKLSKSQQNLIDALWGIGSFATLDPNGTQVRVFDHTRYPFCKLPIRALHELLELGKIKEEILEGQKIYTLNNQL
jgi:hypothetical protein